MKWLIGCGALLLIVVGLLVALGFVLWGEVEEIGDTMRESSEVLEAVEQENPFTVPADKILDPARVDVFLEGRIRLAKYVAEQEAALGSGSVISRIRKGASAFQNSVPEYAATLQEIGMSPVEYSWIANELSYVSQYSKREEVLAEFPQLARLHEPCLKQRKEDDSEGAAGDGFLRGFQTGSEGGGGWQAISQIDPERLTVPRQNVEIVAARADRVAETCEAMFLEAIVVPMYDAQRVVRNVKKASEEIPDPVPAGSEGG